MEIREIIDSKDSVKVSRFGKEKKGMSSLGIQIANYFKSNKKENKK